MVSQKDIHLKLEKKFAPALDNYGGGGGDYGI
jgi:hypothetical protein